MIAMLEANLSAVIRNASSSGVDILLVTWVFQETSFHEMLRRLAPDGTEIMTVQLRVNEAEWRQRFADDCSRPPIDTFFLDRYRAAQTTPADRVIDTTGLVSSAGNSLHKSIAYLILPGKRSPSVIMKLATGFRACRRRVASLAS